MAGRPAPLRVDAPQKRGVGSRATSEFDEAIAAAREALRLAFADVWNRRQPTVLSDRVTVQLPAIADLILTKRFGLRPKDLEDIRLLKILQQEGGTS